MKRTPVFSPDGQTVAFEWSPEEQTVTGLYLQRIDSDTPIRLTAARESVAGAAWSPDGRQIAFFRDDGNTHFSLVSMPANGGTETQWADIVNRPTLDTATVDWTPDGRYFVAADRSKGDPMAVVLISTSTKRKYWITAPPLARSATDRREFPPMGVGSRSAARVAPQWTTSSSWRSPLLPMRPASKASIPFEG
jgi:Tol biopolymer transport system component